MFMASLYPQISKIKNEKKSLSEILQMICSILHTFMTTKIKKVILSEQLFVLLLLAAFGIPSRMLKLKDQKRVFSNISPIIEKIQKSPRNPIIGSMDYGGGSKLKLQGTDSYPVNECTITMVLP